MVRQQIAYSSTPLAKKLGIKEGARICLINAPEEYLDLLALSLPADVTLNELRPNTKFIHYFTENLQSLQDDFPSLRDNLDKAGILWISWRKGNEIKESFVQRIGLASGLVDVKVCAINEEWSGLKFVWRLKDRP